MKKKSEPGWPLSDSSHEPDLLREIIHEPEFEDATRLIFKSIRRADEILEGLEFFLGRRAEMGMAIPRYDPGQPIPGKGRVRVIYHYSDTAVTMLDAWVIPERLEGQFFGRLSE